MIIFGNKNTPGLSTKDMNERWRQFYDKNGGYGMQYEEKSARQKLAYLRHREDWLEEVGKIAVSCCCVS